MTAAERIARDFTLLLPPGWARIPLDGRVPLRVKNLVTERVADVPVEQRETLRAALTRELTAVLESAARQGGLDVLLSVAPVAGQPVPASGLVTHLAGQGNGDALDSLVGTLAAGSGTSSVREIGVVEVAAGPAVRRLTTRRERVDGQGDLPGGVLTVTQVDYFVPLPGTRDLLVLTFTTPIEQLAPPLVQLFDVMGGSLRWVTR
ncbi:hypothetical protein SAMN06272739_0091 [Blastococcus haudaquaticus]|uniref:DUF1795 domain-containing protein n=2 Tax=Blastococcus haudaquaticus TaxID=1938745 RepID=A0A286GBQ0_9ACTN|nr:hypothetical protein SAMN06272739_0091 [Blastococcus haudaquaticus]